MDHETSRTQQAKGTRKDYLIDGQTNYYPIECLVFDDKVLGLGAHVTKTISAVISSFSRQ